MWLEKGYGGVVTGSYWVWLEKVMGCGWRALWGVVSSDEDMG